MINAMKNEGEILRELIKESGVSVKALAQKVRIHEATLHRWFQKEKIDSDYLMDIGKALKVDITKYFTRLSDMVKKSDVKKFAVEEMEISNRLEEFEEQYISQQKDLRFVKDRIAEFDEVLNQKDEIIKLQSEEILFLREQLKNK
jgi:transcriptional regulator with XRE-family HTH domain